VLALGDAGCVYVFTDWRMWVNLFDLVESCGYGVRNMITWDKGAPGMGVGWRSQHELVMFASRKGAKFDNTKARGNVIQCQRTGNVNHTTEKPVELLRKILAVTDFATTIYDPFLGSGSTAVACELEGRTCYGMEIDPAYAAVTLERLASMGLTPELVG
jgi:DNA modification methylase